MQLHVRNLHSPFDIDTWLAEHCIVAFKKPSDSRTTDTCIDASLLWANRGIDTDVVVAEVRETSRKPEEIYSIIERIAPGRNHRRLELFGRKHNVRSGWLTLGNQLGDTCVYEEDIVSHLNQRCVVWPRARWRPPTTAQSLSSP